ncbi:MAG: hypothetical protein IJW08_07765 [Lentisphaeria bacterium]|nr:hypothetical protein [Lentisphaeria bacterium]
MIDYIFGSLARMIYEPLSVAVLVWLPLAFFFCKKETKSTPLFLKRDGGDSASTHLPVTKKSRIAFVLAFGGVICMLLWRIMFHELMVSGRYSSFLIYPTVIFTGCLSVKFGVFVGWVFKKLKLSFKLRRDVLTFIGAVVFIGLLIPCLCKSLRFNTFSDYSAKIARAYLAHCQKPGELHVIDKEHSRIAWYTKKRLDDIAIILPEEDKPHANMIGERVELMKNVQGEHWFIFFWDKKAGVPDSAALQIAPESGSWEIVEKAATSKRRKRHLYLCRFVPALPDIKAWHGKVPDLPPGNITSNAGFEKCRDKNKIIRLQEYFRQTGVTEYFDLSNRKIPDNWWFNIGKWNKDNPPDMRLTEKNPLHGRYSLFMDGTAPKSFASCNNGTYISGKRCNYAFFVRNGSTQSVRFETAVFSRNTESKKYILRKVNKFILPPGKTCRIKGKIPTDTYPEFERNFCLQLKSFGKVTVDQVSFIPY